MTVAEASPHRTLDQARLRAAVDGRIAELQLTDAQALEQVDMPAVFLRHLRAGRLTDANAALTFAWWTGGTLEDYVIGAPLRDPDQARLDTIKHLDAWLAANPEPTARRSVLAAAAETLRRRQQRSAS